MSDAPDDAPDDGDGDEDADGDGRGDPGRDRLDGPSADAGEDGTDPFAELPGADPDDADPFERIDAEPAFEEADPAAVLDADASEDGTDPAAGAGVGEVVVDKRRYCESCEHFADPPEVRCTHEGTEIRELVDTEHFRVYDCPVVARRQKENGG